MATPYVKTVWTTGDVITQAKARNWEDGIESLSLGGLAMASQAAGDLFYALSASQLARIAALANAILMTSGAGVPALSTTLPSAVQDNITRVGTITNAGGTASLSISGVAATATALATARTISRVSFNGTANINLEVVATLTDGATPALDAATGSIFRLAAAGDRTIAVPTNAVAGQKIVIQHYASGGARTLALNTGEGGFRFGTDVTALTQTASGKTDYIGAIYNGTDSRWDVVAYIKGF